MPHHRVQSQQADHFSANPFPPAIHQPHGQILENAAIPPPPGDGRQQVHQEDVPLPADNTAMRGLMQGPHRLPPPYYDAVHNQPQPEYPVVPYMYMQQDGRVAQDVSAHPQAFAPEAQENHDGIFGYPPGRSRGWPSPECSWTWSIARPSASSRCTTGRWSEDIASRYINNQGTRVNMVRVEPGLGGRFEV